MKGKNDFTADRAVGHTMREWRQMAQLAIRIREKRGSPSWIDEQEKEFTGIYSRLLTDPIEDVRRAAR